jgi:hypothetical protein
MILHTQYHFGLNVSLDKYGIMKISQETGGMEEKKCNIHEIKEIRM